MLPGLLGRSCSTKQISILMLLYLSFLLFFSVPFNWIGYKKGLFVGVFQRSQRFEICTS